MTLGMMNPPAFEINTCEVIDVLSLALKANCIIGHETLALSRSDYNTTLKEHQVIERKCINTFSAKVGLSAFAEFAFATF